MTTEKKLSPDGSPSSYDESPQVADLSTIAPETGYIKPKDRKPHDHSVSFEEYQYYAKRSREIEKTYDAPSMDWKAIFLPKKNPSDADGVVAESEPNESGRMNVSDEEWINANRALRVTSWGTCEL